MYTIELTRGRSWDAPVMETHVVNRGIHVAEIKRLAENLLAQAQRKLPRPDSFRISDRLGKRLA